MTEKLGGDTYSSKLGSQLICSRLEMLTVFFYLFFLMVHTLQIAQLFLIPYHLAYAVSLTLI